MKGRVLVCRLAADGFELVAAVVESMVAGDHDVVAQFSH